MDDPPGADVKPKVARVLIKAGANVNARTIHGRTAVHSAAVSFTESRPALTNDNKTVLA